MPHSKLSSNKPPASTIATAASYFDYEFEAIGTAWKIEIFEPLSDNSAAQLKTAIDKRIAVFDKHYSRFRDDSLVAEMAHKKDTYHLPSDAKPLLDLYQELYGVTDGAMTPLIGQTLSDAGYDAGYSLQTKKIIAPPQWDEALEYRFPTLKIKQPALLDFGAAGKGYLVDLLGGLITTTLTHTAGEQKLQNFYINAGGDILYQTTGQQKIEVALEHPEDSTQAIGIAQLHNQSLCGSAGNRRAWSGYHHIISPHNLTSPRHIQALWVVADTALLADGLATALFFVPALKLQERYNFEYAIVYPDYSLEHSPDFPATFFNG